MHTKKESANIDGAYSAYVTVYGAGSDDVRRSLMTLIIKAHQTDA